MVTKTLASAVFCAAALLAATACGQPAGDSQAGLETSIDTDQQASANDIPGVVMARLGGDRGLMILPIEDAPSYSRLATPEQVKACPLDSRYPDCLP
ncbi:hypothetical protein ACQEUU_37730 [Nonomuraea sp. CA-218870]|uniref:hypothetical protein n=1 Tax=Nonomuraea sp. CA-218870 TaxID=3239998 RepID=UPI003D8C3CD8